MGRGDEDSEDVYIYIYTPLTAVSVHNSQCATGHSELMPPHFCEMRYFLEGRLEQIAKNNIKSLEVLQ